MPKHMIEEHMHCEKCKLVLEKEYSPECGLSMVAAQLGLTIPRGVCYARGSVLLGNAIRERIRAELASADARAKVEYRRGYAHGYKRIPAGGDHCPVCDERLIYPMRCPMCGRKFKGG